MTKKENPNSHENQQKPVPASGSLGLLAYGYRGLLAWRLAREEAMSARSDDYFQEKKS